MKAREKVQYVTPGELIAVIEEFVPGEGVFLDGESIRSLHIGKVHHDFSERRIDVENYSKSELIPKVGDEVLGIVESGGDAISNIVIMFVNGERTPHSLQAILLRARDRSHMRRERSPSLCKPGDFIRALIISTTNATIHLSIDKDEYGVVITKCTQCGGRIIDTSTELKCIECGNIEERKIATDFGKIRIKI